MAQQIEYVCNACGEELDNPANDVEACDARGRHYGLCPTCNTKHMIHEFRPGAFCIRRRIADTQIEKDSVDAARERIKNTGEPCYVMTRHADGQPDWTGVVARVKDGYVVHETMPADSRSEALRRARAWLANGVLYRHAVEV